MTSTTISSATAATNQLTGQSTNQPDDPKAQLIWLLAIHRHGDRAPLNMGARDKYNDIKYWPEGFGNLNNAGRKRMYKLGQFIRKRYSHFLSDNFREAYSRSSDVDRCIESAQAVLAGIYPLNKTTDWNKDIPWCPAPVHSVPPSHDYVLNEAGRHTIRDTIDELIKIEKSDDAKKLFADSVKEREIIEREIAYEFDSFVKFKCAFSTLDIEERNGLEMPAWYDDQMKEKLYYLAGKAFALAGGGTEKMKKIRSGHLLDDLIRRMELITSENATVLPKKSDFHQPTNEPSITDLRKFVQYSTHDSILSAFLEAINLNGEKPIPPGFGATFFIELYSYNNLQPTSNSQQVDITNNEKYIRFFYLDDTESEQPIEKHLPNCALDNAGRLTLAAFKKYVEHLLPTSS